MTGSISTPDDDETANMMMMSGLDLKTVVSGIAKRPICHFDIEESPDYIMQRATNMKNEKGVYAPIECTNLRVVYMTSTGLRTRNTFRFSVTNPTNEDYEFMWEPAGDPSPSWQCYQTSGWNI